MTSSRHHRVVSPQMTSAVGPANINIDLVNSPGLTVNGVNVGSAVSGPYCKWILMIMARIIKELMHLLSYEQDLKSLKVKRARNDAKFA